MADSYIDSLQSYFCSFESRIGYRLILGGTRHCGYYPTGAKWPFPISRALREMENHLFKSLNLSAGAIVLDAGCGIGHVAIYMAKKGLRVIGIDIIDHHLTKAKRNIKAANREQQISIRKMDYHCLDQLPSNSFDGVYTMETLVHATDPELVLRQFYQVLKPGGSVALHEYDFKFSNAPKYLMDAMNKINTFASMPANKGFNQGALSRMLEDAGFQNIKVQDLSHNIEPMFRLFFTIAYLPFLIIRFFSLERWFINTVSGVEGFRGRKFWRYIVVTCTKPDNMVKNRSLDISDMVEDENA